MYDIGHYLAENTIKTDAEGRLVIADKKLLQQINELVGEPEFIVSDVACGDSLCQG